MANNAKNMKSAEKKKMPNDMKIFVIVCAVIAVILIAAVVYLIQPKDVAIVQNNRVTVDEFKYFFAQNYQLMAQYSSLVDDPQTLVDYSKQMALSQAIEVEYLLQEAKKEGFKVDQKELDDNWASFENDINTTAEYYQLKPDDFCKQFYLVPLNKLKAIYLDTLLAQKYRETKIAEVNVDEETLAAYYEENKTFFDHHTVRHILISCEKDAEESIVQAKSKLAEDILERVNKGEDFATLVNEYSEDEGSKATGGMYDVYETTNFVPEFMDWTFAHNPGDTGVIRSDYGFHVMKLDAVHNTLDANRDAVKKEVQAEEFQKKVDEVLNGGSYKIEILDGYNEI